MGPQDGVDYALRALAKLRDELGRTDWHAVFVGAGDAFDAMVDLSRQLGLCEQVRFTGRVPDADLVRYLSTADVCLSPDPRNPLNDVSTMNKVLEYMAMGRPIVSFDLKEARVSAGDAAVYAPANDEAQFAGLIALHGPDDAEVAQQMRLAAVFQLRLSRHRLEPVDLGALRTTKTSSGLRPPRRSATSFPASSWSA
ncbi:Glycosyltransferase WbuB OS=Streptomyces antimycoticus OX=68175 GN=SSPO_079700 PE=4 SV=1 [Streptomyces antimycoticus]